MSGDMDLICDICSKYIRKLVIKCTNGTCNVNMHRKWDSIAIKILLTKETGNIKIAHTNGHIVILSC